MAKGKKKEEVSSESEDASESEEVKPKKKAVAAKKGAAAATKKGAAAAAPATKKRKGKSKVRRSASAYNLYVKAVRAKVQAANPDKGFGDLSKIMAEDWKAITPADKKHYENEAAKDKQRYEREKAAHGDSDSDDKPAKKRKKKDPNAPKKSLNAWMFYTNDNRAGVVAELGEDGRKVAEVTKVLAERWGKLTAGQKKVWEDKAAKDKDRYAGEMAKYKAKH